MPERFDLDEMVNPTRKSIDANWSQKKKIVVGSIASGVAAAALITGVVIMIRSIPPALPKTTVEALAVMGSGRFEKLDEQRQRQYAAEASRLMRDMAPDDRRALMQDEKNREAMMTMRMEMFDEMARKYARGEEMQFPFGRRPPRDDKNKGERPNRPERPDPDKMTPEEKEKFDQQRAERRKQFTSRMESQLESGNAQNNSLRGEMFKRMMASGNGFGGRGSGGGRRGGGG